MVVSMGDDAMLLIRVHHDEVRNRVSVHVAHQAIALIDALTGRSPVARHGHPAGVGDDPTAVALVALPNPGSVALHKAVGFEHVGTMREVGYKFDQWIDVAWYQRMLVNLP